MDDNRLAETAKNGESGLFDGFQNVVKVGH